MRSVLSVLLMLTSLAVVFPTPVQGQVSPIATPGVTVTPTLVSPLATPTPGVTPTPAEEWFAPPSTGTPHPLVVKLLTFTAR